MINVPNTIPHKVLSFVRYNEVDKVFAVFNFSNTGQTVTFDETLYHGSYTELFGKEPVELLESSQLTLEPWAYRVFVNNRR
jgi:hypothetical protein